MPASTLKLPTNFAFGGLTLPDPDALKLGLRVSVAIVLATFFACILHLPKPYWAAFTVAAVMRPTAGIGMRRALDRFYGTVIGGIVGYLFAIFLPLTTWTLLGMSFLIMFVGQLAYEHTDHRYSWMLGSVTALLVFNSVVIQPDQTFQVMIARICEIALGVGCGLLVGLVLFPKAVHPALRREIREFFHDYMSIYQDLMAHLTHNKLHMYPAASLKQLDKKLAKIRKTYALFRHEPECSDALKVYYGNQIVTLDRLIIFLNALFQDYRHRAGFYWTKRFKQQIDTIIATTLQLFQHAEDPEQLQAAMWQLDKSLVELDEQVSMLRANKQLLKHPKEHNQALYLFIDIHQGLRAYAERIHNKPQATAPQKTRFFIPVKTLNHKLYIIHSIKSSLAIVLALYCWLHTDWPGGLQGLISSIVIASVFLADDMRTMGFNRIAGCFLGGLTGLLLLHVVKFSLLKLLLTLFLVSFVFAYFSGTSTKRSYLFIQANYA